MPASPASASEAPGPVPHAHPATSKRPRNQTPHVHAARCVGVPAAALCPRASHAGRWDTLEEPCYLMRRRRRAKHRFREQEAVPQRKAVPIVAPLTRAPPPSATALLLGKLEPLYPSCCPLSQRPPRRAPTPVYTARRHSRASPPGQTLTPPPGTVPGPSTCLHSTEAGLRANPELPRAAKPSRRNDQRPRSWPPLIRAASPRRACSQNAA